MSASESRRNAAIGGDRTQVIVLSALLVLCVLAILYLMFIPQRQMRTELRLANEQIAGLNNQITAFKNQIALYESNSTVQSAAMPSRGKEIAGTLYFFSGDVQLTSSGLETLHGIKSTLEQNGDKQIMVEGHADNVQIGAWLQQQYDSNLELSAARAIRVAKFLENKLGIPPKRISVAAFSEYHPVSDNAIAEERKMNRRVEIYLSSPK